MQSSTLNDTLNNENGNTDSLNKVSITSSSIKHLFLVGGFAESSILQESIRKEFGRVMKVVIPQVNISSSKFMIINSLILHSTEEHNLYFFFKYVLGS